MKIINNQEMDKKTQPLKHSHPPSPPPPAINIATRFFVGGAGPSQNKISKDVSKGMYSCTSILNVGGKGGNKKAQETQGLQFFVHALCPCSVQGEEKNHRIAAA